MPGMTGLEVAIAVRDIRPDLPVMLVSDNITSELRKNVPASGIRKLIDKPDMMTLRSHRVRSNAPSLPKYRQ